MRSPSAGEVDCSADRAAGLGRSLGPTAGRIGLAAWLLLCGLAGPALAQLSSEDLAALQRRGEKEGWTFTVAESEATAYSLQELCGAVEPTDWRSGARFDPGSPSRDLPVSYDWRNYEGCTPIKSQGGCGSCWAFAAIGAMECAVKIQDGVDVDLAEQWLVSCTNAGSCSGGWHGSAFNYLLCGGSQDPCGHSGAVLESDFCYVASDIPCECPFLHPYCLDDWTYVGSTGVSQIKQAIYDHGPVAVCVYVNDAFHGYSYGVFNACENDQGTNHVVVLVGWDDNQGTEGVWILRNSWGTGWGMDGYMKIEYGCSRVGSSAAYVDYMGMDCNGNGVWDLDDIAGGTSEDCNNNTRPDECEPEIPEDCAPQGGDDCNGNGVRDACDLACGSSSDLNGNQLPDECEDCNGNQYPDDEDNAAVVFQNYGVITGELDTTAPVAQDLRLGGGALLRQLTVSYRSTGSSPGVMMLRFFEGGPGGSVAPVYPEGLIEEYNLGQLLWTAGDSAYKTVDVEPALWLPSDLWLEVEIEQDAAMILRSEASDIGFTRGLVYDRQAGEMLPGPLYMSLRLVGVQCTSDCNANQIADACDIDCGPAEGDCDVPGCGQNADCNGNAIPDECDLAEGISENCNDNDMPDECETDTDGDGVIDDCDGCPSEPALIEPSEPGAELSCADGIDNDCDGLTDAADPGCAGPGCLCGDLDGNEFVDLNDFATLANCYGLSGPAGDCEATAFVCSDLDGDGLVELSDFATFAVLFGQPASGTPPNCQ